jgi:hypothetical protein
MNAADSAWMLISTALVLFMVPGLALYDRDDVLLAHQAAARRALSRQTDVPGTVMRLGHLRTSEVRTWPRHSRCVTEITIVCYSANPRGSCRV